MTVPEPTLEPARRRLAAAATPPPEGRQHPAGFTLIELLVVIAIIGVLIGLLVAGVEKKRKCDNQEAAIDALLQIHGAQEAFRATDADGDGIDDYGSLAELGALGLLPAEIADGFHEAYFLAVVTHPPPSPSWHARADPLIRDSGTFALFVDPTGVVRRRVTAPAGPSDPVYPVGEPCLLPEPGNDQLQLAIIGKAFFTGLASLSGIDGRIGAAELLASEPRLIDAALTRFDADSGGRVNSDEALSVDLLEMARALVAELELGGGPAVGDDDALRGMLSALQQEIRASLELDVDAPQPFVPLAELSRDPEPVLALLLGTLPVTAIPLFGRLGAIVLTLTLTLAASAALRGARPAP
jgi:prepilin-type N-terminal cleavage/methylation domain-containing protein